MPRFLKHVSDRLSRSRSNTSKHTDKESAGRGYIAERLGLWMNRARSRSNTSKHTDKESAGRGYRLRHWVNRATPPSDSILPPHLPTKPLNSSANTLADVELALLPAIDVGDVEFLGDVLNPLSHDSMGPNVPASGWRRYSHIGHYL